MVYNREKSLYSGQGGFACANVLYSGKVVVIGQKLLYSGKSGCIGANGGCIWIKVVEFGK